MVLLSKAMHEITFQDVVDFCGEGRTEEVHLDYKVEIPDSLAKHIAAMANTLGGTIIIGVEDEDDKPKAPFEGMSWDNDKGYRNKIFNMVHSSIVPPPFIEVANCPDLSKSKTFVIVRIPQSISTPHALSDGSIYIRTGESSNRERIASPDEIAWLYERRKQSSELKGSLVARSARRFSNFLSESGFDTQSVKGAGNAILTLSACPSFPREPLFDYREARKILEEIVTESGLAVR